MVLRKFFQDKWRPLATKGDILILITTSGNSINLIETLKVAKKRD